MVQGCESAIRFLSRGLVYHQQRVLISTSRESYQLKSKPIQNTQQTRSTDAPIDTQPGQSSQPPTRFQDIFHDIPGAVIITDRDGRIHNMNHAARALLGEPDRELELRDWPRAFGLYAPDGSGPFPAEELPPARALRGAKRVAPKRMMLRSKVDSSERPISMSAGPILAWDGAVDGATALIQDIPLDRDSATPDEGRALQAQGLYPFSGLLTTSAQDVNRVATSAAASASEIIGDLSAVTLLEPGTGKFNLIAFHSAEPDVSSQFKDLAEKSVDCEGLASIENMVMASHAPVQVPSSETPQVLTSLMFGRFIQETGVASTLMVPLIGRSGPLGAITMFRRHGGHAYTSADRSFLVDFAGRTALAIENCLLFESLQAEIAARLTAAQALDLSEERFQSIFESTSLGIKILDLSGNILQTNAAFQKIIGYSESEIVGHRFYDFLHPADIVRAVSVFQRLKKDRPSALHFQHRAIHKNGSIVWVNAIFSAVRKGRGDPSLAFIVSILEDVTEQKRFEEEMAELKNRLESTMELERLRLAHELHDGPMQELYSVMYELEELRGSSNAELSQSLRSVSDNINGVLKDLRDTAKELRPPTLSQFGLEKTILSYVGDLKERHPELTVRVSLARDHQLLPEDVRLGLFRVLQQALANILRHAQATEVSIRFSFDAEEARLEVWDNGRGFQVPPTWIEFVRQGHYGLAGAAERINALGGTFVVESQPPESTTVRAVVPWKEHLE